MQNHSESQSHHWFDELPGVQPPLAITPSSSSTFPVQAGMPSAIVVVQSPAERERSVPIWVLAFAAIAGASTFVLGAAVMSLL